MRTIAIAAAAALVGSAAIGAVNVAAQEADRDRDNAYGSAVPAAEPIDVRTLGAGGSTAAAAVALTEQDHLFLDRASEINLAEIETAQIVLAKPDLPDGIAGYARTALDDHKAAQEALTDAVRVYNIEIPSEPSEEQIQTVRMLEGLTGDELVNTYLDKQIEAHMKAIELYEPEAKQAEAGMGATLTPFEDYAARYLPVLRSHLELAQSLQAELNPTAAAE